MLPPYEKMKGQNAREESMNRHINRYIHRHINCIDTFIRLAFFLGAIVSLFRDPKLAVIGFVTMTVLLPVVELLQQLLDRLLWEAEAAAYSPAARRAIRNHSRRKSISGRKAPSRKSVVSDRRKFLAA